jgi:hypothetical protein
VMYPTFSQRPPDRNGVTSGTGNCHTHPLQFEIPR